MAYDPTSGSFSNVNYLRLLTGDTNATYIVNSDNELGAIITRHTESGVIKWDVCAAWALRAMAVSPSKLWTLKQAIGSGLSVPDLMDLMWARAEAIFGAS